MSRWTPAASLIELLLKDVLRDLLLANTQVDRLGFSAPQLNRVR